MTRRTEVLAAAAAGTLALIVFAGRQDAAARTASPPGVMIGGRTHQPGPVRPPDPVHVRPAVAAAALGSPAAAAAGGDRREPLAIAAPPPPALTPPAFTSPPSTPGFVLPLDRVLRRPSPGSLIELEIENGLPAAAALTASGPRPSGGDESS